MKTRKIILLSSIAVLIFIYGIQLILNNKSPIKIYKLKETPNKITITNQNNEITLEKVEDIWYIKNTDFLADEDIIEEFIDSICNIKTLGIVSNSNAESELERYGLNEIKTIKVNAFNSDKTIRSIIIGKDSVSPDHNYIRIDSSQNTLLAAGNLRNIYDKTIDDIKKETDSEDTTTLDK